MALILLFAPGVLFLAGLVVLRGDPRLATLPWELWLIALAGTTATIAGSLDWRYHRTTAPIGGPEHRAHVLALGLGGGSVFVLMGIATVAPTPLVWLIPVLVMSLLTASLICYDEFVFHRRRKCSPYESRLHRTLVFGNGTAFLAWVHWVFVRVHGA